MLVHCLSLGCISQLLFVGKHQKSLDLGMHWNLENPVRLKQADNPLGAPAHKRCHQCRKEVTGLLRFLTGTLWLSMWKSWNCASLSMSLQTSWSILLLIWLPVYIVQRGCLPTPWVFSVESRLSSPLFEQTVENYDVSAWLEEAQSHWKSTNKGKGHNSWLSRRPLLPSDTFFLFRNLTFLK